MSTVSKKYIRDKRSPVPKNDAVSQVMSANRGKDTKPEIALRKALWAANKRGYRLHKRIEKVRPDIIFSNKKIAIFVHGCFWHRCPMCKLPMPKTNREFWKKKFMTNQNRDVIKRKLLEGKGWKVYEFWECEINERAQKLAKRVKY